MSGSDSERIKRPRGTGYDSSDDSTSDDDRERKRRNTDVIRRNALRADAEEKKAVEAEREYTRQLKEGLKEVPNAIINRIKKHHQEFPQDVENKIRENINDFITGHAREIRVGLMNQIKLELRHLKPRFFQVHQMEGRVFYLLHRGLDIYANIRNSQLKTQSLSETEEAPVGAETATSSETEPFKRLDQGHGSSEEPERPKKGASQNKKKT